MKVFLFLYFLNLVLDYPLQGTFLAEYKAKKNYILFVHSAIWALGLMFGLVVIGMFAWWKVIMLLVGHYIIDYWKCRGLYKKWPKKKSGEPLISDWFSLYIDQFLHIVQVSLCLI